MKERHAQSERTTQIMVLWKLPHLLENSLRLLDFFSRGCIDDDEI